MSMKRKILALLPETLRRPIYRAAGMELPLDRVREFPSWKAATIAGAQGYQDDDLVRFRVARARAVGNDFSGVRLPKLLTDSLNEDLGTLVDLGGSTGETCMAFRKLHPGWMFVVVENRALAAAATTLGRPVEFRETLPDQMDVLFSSGTLQYLPDPLSAFGEALGRTTRHAVLARNCFSDRQHFCLQSSYLFENGYGPVPPGFVDRVVTYPHQTLVESDVIAVANDRGFDLVGREVEQSGVLDPATMYGADLRFSRRT